MLTNIMKTPFKLPKDKVTFEYPVHNVHGLDVRVFGCHKGILSFIVVQKELASTLKGIWAQCTGTDYYAGLLEDLTLDKLQHKT